MDTEATLKSTPGSITNHSEKSEEAEEDEEELHRISLAALVKEVNSKQHITIKLDEDEHDKKPHGDEKRKHKTTFVENFREFCARADMFASAHVWPIHILCIVVASVIIPISAVAIIWDLLSAIVFQIPDLSTINTPAFVLFMNFIAMPLAMYGYMMEYLLHENSKLAIVALICVVVHPILFTIRALMENFFGGYRGEEKIFFESFLNEGQEQKYPIGMVRYREGEPYSDSIEGQELIDETFEE